MRIRIWISLPNPGRLIFFSSILVLSACLNHNNDLEKRVSVIWKEDRAVALNIPLSNYGNIPDDSVVKMTSVCLPGTTTSIAGRFRQEKTSLIFEPLIPFTRGLRYDILIGGDSLSQIVIPRSATFPELLGIYPIPDTVPENLLKIYLVFSKPMREGHSLEFVSLHNDHGDSLPQSFLSLHPELWNPERTILTLWLDPGRIKRDLKPNRSLGAPLVNGRKYQLVISATWPDQEGNVLGKSYAKSFYASNRDSLCPRPDRWTLRLPISGGMDSLGIFFHEPIDYFLLLNSFRFLDASGKLIDGNITVGPTESSLFFAPIEKWKAGTYTIQIDSRLEDLAGNNLNRPFDRDLNNQSMVSDSKRIHEKKFQIQ